MHMKDTTLNLQPEPPTNHHERAGRRWPKWIVALIILVAGWWLWSTVAAYMSWRAIFLNNNQVYFGHFWDLPFASAITLHNVYYLEIAQPAQQLTGQDQSQQLKLVRLGNEIHGPTNEMTIPMAQVLFWETLRPDSAVVAAIKSLGQ